MNEHGIAQQQKTTAPAFMPMRGGLLQRNAPAASTPPLAASALRAKRNDCSARPSGAQIPLALQTLHGEPIQDTWQLKVAELAGLDKGKLNRWVLRLTCEPWLRGTKRKG